MIRWQPLWAWCLLLACAVPPVQGADRTPSQRLADQFVRDAAELLETDPLTSECLDAALQLVQEAIALVPRDADLWRLARDVAALAEREDLRRQAIQQVAKLDPADEVAKLMRLSLAVERYQTADERIVAYETLLSEDNRWQLGDAVASRLALDLALLHRRRNEMAAFSRWLGEAAAIDPGNRSAAAVAAGFYMASGGEPYGGAELLVNLMLTDPGDLTTRSTLANLLLTNGAYDGAARILSDLVDHRYLVDPMTGEGWLINHALAQWAAGEPDVALATLDRRQQDADHRHRGEARRDQPDLSALEIARMAAPLDPKLATLAAAIRSRLGSPDAASMALADAVDAFERTIEELAADPEADPQVVARLHLELAWVASWLGADADLIEQHVDAADGLVELTELARLRFAGWQALRGGDPAGAEAMLAPLAETDPAAHLGLALARLDQGDRRDAAAHLRDIARAQPGAMLGVWAGEALFEILGRRAPLTGDATRLDELIQSVPRVFDRYLENPTHCFGLRLEPTEVRFAPMTPVIIDAVIANNSTHPLGIDRDGPLRPQLLMQVSARMPGAVKSIDLEAIIVDIDRAVTLQPKQRLRVPVNLSRTSVGRLLRNNPVPGMILRIKGTINFVA
jgi:tetratricopeptide (TPR) repeat protein